MILKASVNLLIQNQKEVLNLRRTKKAQIKNVMKGKVVWITGASSGIGLALAKAYSQKGAYLIVSARRSRLLEEFQNQLPNPEDCCVLPLDLQNHKQASQWV